MNIQEHVTSEFIHISKELRYLAVKLATAQVDIAQMQTELAKYKRERDQLKANIVMTRGGYAQLGKNEKERELALDDICNRTADYRQLDNSVNRTADEITLAQSDFSALCRQYNAVAHHAQLTASMINMLAGPAGQSMADLPVPVPSPDPGKGSQPEDLGL